MTILQIVSSGHYIPETGIHTYVSDLSSSLNKKGYKSIIVIIKDRLDSVEFIDNTIPQIFINISEFKRELLNVINQYNPTYCHFHSIFPFELFNEILRELRSNEIKSILTIHNNSLLCYKGSMAFKNKHFCVRNDSYQRCLRCIVDQHKFSTPLFLLNIANSFFHVTNNYRLNYLTLLNNFQINVLELLQNIDEVIILDQWVLHFLPKEIEELTSVTLIQQATKAGNFVKKSFLPKGAETKLAYIGRTDQTKGLLVLVKALKNIEHVRLDCYVEVTDQLYYEQILKIVKDYQLNVNFFDPIKHQQMNEVLITYDLLCLPSFAEMAPMLSLEALDFGIPIIASDHPSFVSQSKLNSGISLFKNSNVNSLNKVIRDTIENTPSMVSNNCDYDDLILKHIKLYNVK